MNKTKNEVVNRLMIAHMPAVETRYPITGLSSVGGAGVGVVVLCIMRHVLAAGKE